MKIQMEKQQLINQVILGDSLELLKKISDNSIDLVLTDPPYFLDKLDNNWNYQQVINKKNQYTVKSLPAGMKFSREQGIKFYKWFYNLSEQIFRVLKPGGFFFSFSSPRLYHRMTSAIDDAGFEIRDCFLWIYTQNQAKAMGMDHLIKKMKITEEEKEVISKKLDGWKTPQIKSCFEPIAMAQKPVEKTYLSNILAHNVGLFNTKIKVGDNMFPSNILLVDEVDGELDRYFLISKPNKQEKEGFNDHMTVKPVSLCEHIINLATFSEDAIVLDPFLGSGTTALAAKNLGRKYIGIEINPEYVEISKKRLDIERQTLF